MYVNISKNINVFFIFRLKININISFIVFFLYFISYFVLFLERVFFIWEIFVLEES